MYIVPVLATEQELLFLSGHLPETTEQPSWPAHRGLEFAAVKKIPLRVFPNFNDLACYLSGISVLFVQQIHRKIVP